MKNLSKAITALKKSGINPQPIPKEYRISLEVAIQADLPQDYAILLEKFGTFELPGEPFFQLYNPAVVCAYVSSIYNMEDLAPADWPALPIGRWGKSGDDIGFLRSAEYTFGNAVVILDHEGPWTAKNDFWHSPLAPSFSQFVIDRHEAFAS